MPGPPGLPAAGDGSQYIPVPGPPGPPGMLLNTNRKEFFFYIVHRLQVLRAYQ